MNSAARKKTWTKLVTASADVAELVGDLAGACTPTHAAKQREQPLPEQQRALTAGPHAGELVEPRRLETSVEWFSATYWNVKSSRKNAIASTRTAPRREHEHGERGEVADVRRPLALLLAQAVAPYQSAPIETIALIAASASSTLPSVVIRSPSSA